MARVEHVRTLASALVAASIASPAFAYIDPNIGGQLAQILAPIVTLVIGALAFARQWLKAFFAGLCTRLRAVFARVRG